MDNTTFTIETDDNIFLEIHSKISEKNSKALLLVHGSGVGWICYDIPIRDYSIMDHCASNDIDVYAVECRGYGKSTKPNGKFVTIDSITKDLNAVIEFIQKKSDVKKVSIAAHSYGGLIVMKAATLYSEIIERIILIGTPYSKIHPTFEKYANKMVKLAKVVGIFMNNYVPNMHTKKLHEKIDDFDDDIIIWYKNVIKTTYSKMPGGLFLNLSKNLNILPKAKNIAIPTFVLYGSNEYVVDSEDLQLFISEVNCENKEIKVLIDSFHLPFLEKKGNQKLREIIVQWMKQ